MSNYTQLDIDHKRALLLQMHIISLTFNVLESLSGEPQQEWIREITKIANLYVNGLSDRAVEDLIVEIQNKHNSAIYDGQVFRIEPKK